jgi:hypothetical protein
MAEELLQRAMSAYKAGRKDEARSLFMDIVEQDQHHEEAWLYLSALVDTLEEQQICLENVLTVNPNNEKAKAGLELVKQKRSAQQEESSASATPDARPPSSATPPETAAPFEESSSPPIGAEFSASAGDNLFGEPTFGEVSEESPSAFGSDFAFGADSSGFATGSDSSADAGLGSDDPFSWLDDSPGQPSPDSASPATPPPAPSDSLDAPASSVDWGRADQPAVYGSGRSIDEPTSEDYDNWMDSLPLGAETSDAPVPKTDSDSAFGSAPFGDASYMAEDDSFAADDLFGQETPAGPFGDSGWDSSSDSGETGNSSSDSSAAALGAPETDFGLSSSEPFESVDEDLFEAAGGFADDEDEPAETSAFGSSPFDVDDAANTALFAENELTDSGGGFDFSFSDDDDAPPKAEVSQGKGASKAAAAFFRQIPNEVEPFEGGISQRSLVLLGAIVLLVVLNGVSLAMLLT